jgi:hypothetical protein
VFFHPPAPLARSHPLNRRTDRPRRSPGSRGYASCLVEFEPLRAPIMWLSGRCSRSAASVAASEADTPPRYPAWQERWIPDTRGKQQSRARAEHRRLVADSGRCPLLRPHEPQQRNAWPACPIGATAIRKALPIRPRVVKPRLATPLLV